MSQINEPYVKQEVYNEVHDICEKKIRLIENDIGDLNRRIVAIQFDRDVALVRLEALKGILDIVDVKFKDTSEEKDLKDEDN